MPALAMWRNCPYFAKASECGSAGVQMPKCSFVPDWKDYV